jgi:hypothetical protein
MKAYIVTTGSAFGLLTLVHLWRMLGPEGALAAEPWYIAITLAAAGMSLWGLAGAPPAQGIGARLGGIRFNGRT